MLVGVSCLVTCCFHNFEDGVNANALVGIQICAFAVHERLWEVERVDAAGEELAGVVVFGFIVGYCSR